MRHPDRRPRCPASLLVLLVIALGTSASVPVGAQEKPAAPPSATPSGKSLKQTIATARWTHAQRLLKAGRQMEAWPVLLDLAENFPETVEGQSAAAYIQRHPNTAPRGTSIPGTGEMMVRSGFIGWLAAQSIAIAGFGDDVLPSSDKQWLPLVPMALGGGLGVGAGYLVASRLDITPSQAIALHSHAWMGFVDGMILYDLAMPLDRKSLYAGLGGMAIGIGVSALTWNALRMEPGAAQFAQNFSFFALETALFGSLAVGGGDVFSKHEKATLATIAVIANGALAAGYFMGKALRWTEEDQLLIATGGAAGTLLGGLIVVVDGLGHMFQSGGMSGQEVGEVMLGTMAAGLGVATLIVRPWRHAGRESSLSERSPRSGKGSLIHLDETGIHAGFPTPHLFPSQHKGRSAIGLQVPLLTVGL